MADDEGRKQQLIAESGALRRRPVEPEGPQAQHQRAEGTLRRGDERHFTSFESIPVAPYGTAQEAAGTQIPRWRRPPGGRIDDQWRGHTGDGPLMMVWLLPTRITCS
jgi:hypothetical protein